MKVQMMIQPKEEVRFDTKEHAATKSRLDKALFVSKLLIRHMHLVQVTCCFI